VFLLDLVTPVGVEVWVLNVPLTILALWMRSVRVTAALGLAASAMVVVGGFVSAPGPEPPAWDVLNRGLGLATIWMVAAMAIVCIRKSQQLDGALRRVREEAAELERVYRALEHSAEAERETMESEVLAIAAREQRQVGQELHDDVGQHLTGLGLMAQSLVQRLAEPAERLVAERLVGCLNEAHQRVRELARGLVASYIEHTGLRAALDDLARRTTEAAGVSVSVEYPEEVEPPDGVIATQLFRIAQEAICNAVRHAKPRLVQVSVQLHPDGLQLCVRDDGVGIRGDSPTGNGLGLRIMRYRADQIGAVLHVGPAQGGGTLVTCTLKG
jgi:signal transduction histidine kinase